MAYTWSSGLLCAGLQAKAPKAILIAEPQLIPRAVNVREKMEDPDSPAVGWIDYVIASDDADDRALAAEFAVNWKANQAMQDRILAEGPTLEVWQLIERQHRETDELRGRVYARGKALADSGAQPADRGVFEAWIEINMIPRTLM
jgi:hypothetical protein